MGALSARLVAAAAGSSASTIALMIAAPVVLFVLVLAAHFAFPKLFARRPDGFAASRRDVPRVVRVRQTTHKNRSDVLRHPLAEALPAEKLRLAGNDPDVAAGSAAIPLTLNSLLLRAAALYPDRPFLGRRVGSGPFVWKTYNDAADEIYLLACALRASGLRQGDRVALYSHNSPFWVLGASGASSGAMPTVPLYDSWGEDIALDVLKASHVSALLTSRRHLPSVVRMAASLPTVKLIVLLEDETLECDRTAVAGLAAISDRVRFLSFNDALDAGRRSPVDLSRPSPDDIATICFTSGSGGRPRGAVLTHGNLCSVVASARLSGLEFGPRDVHLSYIPLAHMFERLVVSAIIAGGGSIGFYRGNVAMLLDDAIELRPTVFPSVPRVWNRIHDRITAAMNNAQEISSPLSFLARLALSAKLRAMKGDATLCRIPLLDFLFFRGARARLGGRVRFMICGSAPIRGPVLSELSAVLGAVVCEGYGGTEYAAGGCITWPGDPMGGVGGPVACAEFCLESVPAFDCFAGADMPKTTAGTTAGQDDGPPPRARGEILIRGPHVCAGYDLDEDKLTVTEDGWLRTGDVGVLRDNGTLEIIDRVKSLLKLSQGEYIAPVRVESALLECGAVSQVWVDAGRMMPAILAVAVLDPTTAPAWLAERGVTDPKNKTAVAAALLAEFRSISAAAGLNSLETVKGVIVEDESAMFSVDNGLLTASLKVIRGKLREKYTGQFTAMYKSLGIK